MPEVWHYPPNSIAEVLEFMTDVRRARTQERRDSFKDATQRLSYGYTVEPHIAEKMIGEFAADTAQEFSVPEWPTATISSTLSITALDTTADVEDGAAYQVGQDVLIGVIGGAWEVVTVDSIATDTLTFTSAVVASYTGTDEQPAFIAPLITAIAPNGIEYASRYPVRDLTITFLSVSPVDLGQNPYSIFETRPIVNDGDVAFSPLAGAVARARVLVDSSFGSYAIVESEDFNRRYGTLSFYDETYAERFERRRFLHFMRGMDGEMWVETGQRDIILNGGFSSGSLSLDVQPFTTAANMVGKVIQVKEGANSVIKTITAATENSETSTTIEFSGTMGFAGTANAEVGFLTKSRFDADAMNLSYQFTASGLVSAVSVPVVEVP